MANRDKFKRFQDISLRGSNKLPSLENFKQRKAYAEVFPTETEDGTDET